MTGSRRSELARGVLLGAALAFVAGACASSAASRTTGTTSARVADAERRLAAMPRLYPVWAELGEARLDVARVTRDPEEVARAEEAFRRSLSIQDNFVARRGMLALACFRHRFEDALAWAPKAEEAMPEDTSVLALHVEALLALGRVEEAEELSTKREPRSDDFHGLAARANVLLARGRVDESVRAYDACAAAAHGRSDALEAWAHVRAAAARLDHGDAEGARPQLERALALDPDGVDANVHAAELDEATGDRAAALARLERVLARFDDPAVAAAAARVAHAIGDEHRARANRERAEHVFRRATDAGEVYAIGALARLLADTDGDLDEALALARRHATIVRTAESRALVERIEVARGKRTSGPRA